MLAISRRSAAPQPGGAQSDLPMTANKSPMVRARICSRKRGLMCKLPTPKAAMPGGNFAFKSLAILRGLPKANGHDSSTGLFASPPSSNNQESARTKENRGKLW